MSVEIWPPIALDALNAAVIASQVSPSLHPPGNLSSDSLIEVHHGHISQFLLGANRASCIA